MATHEAALVLYEYPFNESVRTMLRLEHLFGRLQQLLAREEPVDHHFALVTLFEIIDVAARADLKSDVLKELEKHRQQMDSFRGHPGISEQALAEVTERIDQAFNGLNQLQGKAGHSLTANDWLMGIRSRISIPGGTCAFDLPGYFGWQQLAADRRRSDLSQWIATLRPLEDALTVLLGLLRTSGNLQRMMAPVGSYQQSLPAGKTYQLARVRLDGDTGLVPEITGHRLMVGVRFMRPDADGKLRPAGSDTTFELALCT